jgi:hypothetical protein
MARLVPPLARYAADRGVKLLAENCPMEGWHPDGYPANLAYSPELWDWMAGLGFGLTYDPSHLPWLGIDPLDALEHALQAGMIGHVQAKDIQIDERARTRCGVFGKTAGRASPTDTGWWRYRVPGRGSGQLDWNKIIDALYSAGYDGDIAVEHEDPVWGGTTGRILQGMQIAASTLLPLITTEPDAQPPAPRPWSRHEHGNPLGDRAARAAGAPFRGSVEFVERQLAAVPAVLTTRSCRRLISLFSSAGAFGSRSGRGLVPGGWLKAYRPSTFLSGHLAEGSSPNPPAGSRPPRMLPVLLLVRVEGAGCGPMIQIKDLHPDGRSRIAAWQRDRKRL